MDEFGDDPTPDNPEPEALPAPKPAEEEKPKKYDGFYKPWDRFTEKKKFTSGVPSLDVDSEGRPGHAIRRNTEGVISRYVPLAILQSWKLQALMVSLSHPD